VLSFLVGEALRDLRRIGLVGASAIALIALSLAILGGFGLFSLNLERAISQWRDRVRLVVYLREEPAAGKVDDLIRRIEAVEGVQAARYVSKAEALQALKRSLGARAEVADQLPRNPLPASLEITPDALRTTPDGNRDLVTRLEALPEVEEVQGGTQWVEGLAQFRRLCEAVGLAVGAVLAVAAILTVMTATTLVLHLRRDELEIMRLVGAAESVIRFPRLLQGGLQGLLAAVLALAGLEVAFALTAPRLEPLLAITLGLEGAHFFSVPQMLLLIGGGAALGAVGGMLGTRPARA
jgi:cell division transport system permease protein